MSLEQFATGDYVCYVTDKHDSGWEVFQDYKKPELFVFGSEILTCKLIHKKHAEIADAIIENPDLEVYSDIGGLVFDFFKEYDEIRDYRIKPKQDKVD